MIRAILACDMQLGIGKDGSLPWPKNKEDLLWFKRSTENSIVVMGRNTWDDPNMPKPLPNRYNIVISDRELDALGAQPNVLVPRQSAKKVIKSITEDVWVIGGGKLFEELWDTIDEVWVSFISGAYTCDTFAPSLKTFDLFYREIDLDKQLDIRKYRRCDNT